ncbi:MAG: BCD family MFS transporter [Myxococcota bacterium]
MTALDQLTRQIMRVGHRYLPFADAATEELPMGRLLRLSLFQVSVGMAVVLLNGTLNRVMILELGIPAWLVAFLVSLPILFAPFRALVGHRSDHHRSALGWRRVPYIWMGTLLQFGGLAIMPFALLVLSTGGTVKVPWAGEIGAGLAFLFCGVGLHTTQTAGLALATDLAPANKRPRVVALLYMMLLVGMIVSALLFGWLLDGFNHQKLVQVIQAAGILTLGLNLVALWKQEGRQPQLTGERFRPSFRESWSGLLRDTRTTRLLVVVGLGTVGFSMQDILLEPYGGEILDLSVAATTALTALLAGGTLLGFGAAAYGLGRGSNPHYLSAMGSLAGVVAFTAVIFADPLGSALLFRVGTFVIGFGSGLFGVGTLTAAMALSDRGESGLALGAWGAVQATAAGGGIALGGALRDIFTYFAEQGLLGPALTGPSAGYTFVYHLEVALLFLTLVAVGPLVRRVGGPAHSPPSQFGLAELPG